MSRYADPVLPPKYEQEGGIELVESLKCRSTRSSVPITYLESSILIRKSHGVPMPYTNSLWIDWETQEPSAQRIPDGQLNRKNDQLINYQQFGHSVKTPSI